MPRAMAPLRIDAGSRGTVFHGCAVALVDPYTLRTAGVGARATTVLFLLQPLTESQTVLHAAVFDAMATNPLARDESETARLHESARGGESQTARSHESASGRCHGLIGASDGQAAGTCAITTRA